MEKINVEYITNKYMHVIWDWNGTLLDDVQLCTDIINNILKRRDLPGLTIEKYKEIFTFPVIEYYKTAGLDVSGNNFEIMSHEFINEYEARKLNCSLYEGGREILEYFDNKGISQSVLSAYSQHTLEEIINYFGLSRYFIKLVGLNNIYAASKVENGIKWINEIGIDPRKVLMFGDTLHDYDVANKMGVDCILFAGGHQSQNILSASNSEIISSHLELLKT